MKNSKEFWDKMAARYAKQAIKDEAAYQKKLSITRGYFQPDWSVLEFGCGTGSTAIAHAPYVKQITATDISEKMLTIAEQKTRDAGIDNISYQQGTLDNLPLQAESYDAVLGLNVLHLLEDVPAALSRVHGLLKPGGIFVSSTALIRDMKAFWRVLIPLMQLVGLAPYVNCFGKQELLAMLNQAGFEIDCEWQPNRASVFVVAKKCV